MLLFLLYPVPSSLSFLTKTVRFILFVQNHKWTNIMSPKISLPLVSFNKYQNMGELQHLGMNPCVCSLRVLAKQMRNEYFSWWYFSYILMKIARLFRQVTVGLSVLICSCSCEQRMPHQKCSRKVMESLGSSSLASSYQHLYWRKTFYFSLKLNITG